MPEDQALLDTRDMVALHGVFRRALGELPAQISSVREGDTERARLLAAYVAEVLWLLHSHHEGEDALLYPLLLERLPEQSALFATMAEQHDAVTAGLESAEVAAKRFGASASATDGLAVADACTSLLSTMQEHLDEEERQVLPLAARVISPPEWGALPAHALASYAGTRVWMPFGLAMESMPEDIQAHILEQLPPPVSGMWLGGGADAFAAEIRAVRGTAI